MPKLSEARKKQLKDPDATTSPGDPEEAPAPTISTATLTEIDDKINALWYGEGGSGKTTNLARMAEEGKVLFINAEAGIKVKPLQRMGVKIENIEVFPRPNDPESKISFAALEDTYWAVKNDLDNDPNSWAGVGFDSLTEITKKLLDEIVAHQFAAAERAGKSRDRFFIDRADYGVMTEQVRLLLRRYRDLPCHFGATALERRDQDHDGVVRYGPALTPALQNDVNGFFDVVCHTTVEQIDEDDEWRGLFRQTGKYYAKDRYGAMPRRLVDPTFDRIRDYITETIDLESDPVMAEAKARSEAAAQAAKDAAAAKG